MGNFGVQNASKLSSFRDTGLQFGRKLKFGV